MSVSLEESKDNVFQVVEGSGAKDSLTSPRKPGSTKRNFSKKTSGKPPELGDIDFNENHGAMKHTMHDGNMSVTSNSEGKVKMSGGY